MGRKGRKSKGSATKVKPLEVETTLLSMKKSRGDAAKQAKLCQTLQKYICSSPFLFEDNSFSNEASLCVLLALKTDPYNTTLQKSGICALCALFLTRGGRENILRLGGLKALMTLMDHGKLSTEILVTILETMACLCCPNNGPNHYYGLMMVTEGFVWRVTEVMETHPEDVAIQFYGTQVLRGVICSCIHNEQLLKEAIQVTVSTLKRFGGSHREDRHDNVLFQCYNIFVQLIDSQPNSINSIQNAGAPTAVLTIMKNHPGQAKLQTMGSLFLLRFVNNDKVLGSECFPTVVSALKLHCQVEGVRKAAVAFITEMITSKHGALLLFSSGYVSFFFEMMELNPGHDCIQYLGCRTVACLARWDETREAVLTEESASLVAATTKACDKACDFEESNWGISCFEAMASFLAHDKASLLFLALQTECAVRATIKVVKGIAESEAAKSLQDDSDLWFVLYVLAWCGDDTVNLQIAEEGGVGTLLTNMRLKPEAHFLQCTGCKTLGLLTTCKHPVILESIAKADGVNILMDAIERFPDDKNIFNFGGSAALLTREFELGRI